MGKRKIDPETGKYVKNPSDFKIRKPRTSEQNAASRNSRRGKGLDRGRIRPLKNTKVYFLRQWVRQLIDVVCRDPR